MENIIISKLNKKDIHKATKLLQDIQEVMYEKRNDIFIRKDKDWEEYLQTKLIDKDFVLLSASINDELVGICSAEIKHCGDGKDTRIRDILFIDYIVVDEKYRRLKIGTRFLDEIKKIAKENKISSVELNVWGFNSGAISFYEKNDMQPKRIVYEFFVDKEN